MRAWARIMALTCWAAFMPGLVVAAPDAPTRVVSLNLCTDQLAMLLAGDGQLVSVSALAHDPRASAMVDVAAAYPINRGMAEEVFLLDPDLVIAGTFTDRVTVDMLRRLGIPVATIAPAYRLDDVPTRLREVGALLGREAEAETLIATYQAGLAALAHDDARPRGAIYGANAYASGPKSLSGGILDAAGFDNVAAGLGITTGGRLALEHLVLSAPDILILTSPYPGAARAEEVLDHPALARLRARAGVAPLTDRDWVCGTPYVLRAIEGLAKVRTDWQAAQ